MALELFMQHAIVALAVVLSAVFLVQWQWPAAVRRLRVGLALWLLREGRGASARRLARMIAPRPSAAGAGCDGCDGCGPSA